MFKLSRRKMDTDRLAAGIRNTAEKTGQSIDEVKAKTLEEVPASRMGTAEEFGNVCAFLCSKHAGYITGRSILVDGGLYNSAF